MAKITKKTSVHDFVSLPVSIAVGGICLAGFTAMGGVLAIPGAISAGVATYIGAKKCISDHIDGQCPPRNLNEIAAEAKRTGKKKIKVTAGTWTGALLSTPVKKTTTYLVKDDN